MAILANSSIAAFLKALKENIRIFSAPEITKNIDNSCIDKINAVLTSYNLPLNNEISEIDLKKISRDDLKKLLEYIGQDEQYISYMLNSLENSYLKIANLINNYVENFYTIKATQSQMFNEKINLYKKYIDLFEREQRVESFEEIAELSKVMFEVGLDEETRWEILLYIAELNIEAVEDPDYINLRARIDRENERISSYLEDEKVKEILNARLAEEVDIDTIPTIAAELSKTTFLNEEILINILSVVVSENLLSSLKISGNEEDKKELKEVITSVLDNIKDLKPAAVYEAENIKKERFEFYYNSLLEGISEEDLKKYVDLPLLEITVLVQSREYAIDLKELALMKAIFETLDTLESLTYESPEYQKAINILQKLNQQYRILEEKKNNKVETKI